MEELTPFLRRLLKRLPKQERNAYSRMSDRVSEHVECRVKWRIRDNPTHGRSHLPELGQRRAIMRLCWMRLVDVIRQHLALKLRPQD